MSNHTRARAIATLVGALALLAGGAPLAPAGATGDVLCQITGTCPTDPDPDPDPATTASRTIFTWELDRQADLYVADSASGAVTALAGLNSPATERDAAVSPDGRSIAFSSDRAGDFDLYVADLDDPAGTLRRVTSARGNELGAAWSPEPGTRRLAYGFDPFRGNEPTHVRIFDLDVEGGNDHALTPGEFSESPAWSPTGDRLAVIGWSSGRDVMVYTVGSDAPPVQLTSGTWSDVDKSPDWSPDGEWVLFTSYRREFHRGRFVLTDWALVASRPVDADDNGLGDDLHEVYAEGGSKVDQADWHPDGMSVAFSTGKLRRVSVTQVPTADGIRLQAGTPQDLTDGPDHHHQPEWWRDPVG